MGRLVAALTLLLVLAATHARAYAVRRIVDGDAQAPGMPGVSFHLLGLPAISANGEIAFVASLQGTGISSGNNGSVWAGDPNDPRLLLQTGSAVPGLPGVTYAAFTHNITNASVAAPVVTSTGRVVVDAQLAGSGVTSANQHAIVVAYFDGSGQPQSRVWIRQGDVADGALTFASLNEWAFNGEYDAVYVQLSGSGPFGIWRGRWDTAPQKVLRNGDPSTPALGGTSILSISDMLSVDAGGRVAAYMVINAGATGLYEIVTATSASDATYVARAGDPVSEPNYDYYTFNGVPILGTSGDVLFVADTICAVAGSCPANSHVDVFMNAARLMTVGEPLPPSSLPSSYVWYGPPTVWESNASGQALLSGHAAPPGSTSSAASILFVGPPGGLTLLAASGQPTPGGPFTFADFAPPFMNDHGTVAFFDSGGLGIWAGAPGDVQAVAVENQTVQVPSTCALQTLASVTPTSSTAIAPGGASGQDGRVNVISNGGLVVFRGSVAESPNYSIYLGEPTQTVVCGAVPVDALPFSAGWLAPLFALAVLAVDREVARAG